MSCLKAQETWLSSQGVWAGDATLQFCPLRGCCAEDLCKAAKAFNGDLRQIGALRLEFQACTPSPQCFRKPVGEKRNSMSNVGVQCVKERAFVSGWCCLSQNASGITVRPTFLCSRSKSYSTRDTGHHQKENLRFIIPRRVYPFGRQFPPRQAKELYIRG